MVSLRYRPCFRMLSIPGYIVAPVVFPSTCFPSYQSSTKPTPGSDDHFTCRMKSCHAPRSSGCVHSTVTSVPVARYIDSPLTYISSGGVPLFPLWCHCVNACQVATDG